MNRTLLKIIAVITMLIDHIGAYLLPNLIILRIIGRLAFPIFAYFIAEGWKHTSSRKKYVFNLLIFAIISQIPYTLLTNSLRLNILFTFLIAIWLINILDLIIKNNQKENIILLIGVCIIILFGDLFNLIDYGTLGVCLIVIFYYISNRNYALITASIILTILSLREAVANNFAPDSFIQLTSLISLILIYFYNNNAGNKKLKYLFYIFYPAHLLIILLTKLII